MAHKDRMTEQNRTAESPSERLLAQIALREQIAMTYRYMPIALIVSIAPVLALWWTVHDVFPGPRSTYWLIASLVLIATRLIAGPLTHRAKQSPEAAGLLNKWFLTGTIAYGMQWGYAGLMLFPDGHPHLQMAVVAILFATAASTFPFVLPLRGLYGSLLIPMFTPFAVKMLLTGSVPHIFVGVLTITFVAIVMLATERIGGSVALNIISRIRQTVMTEELRKAHEETKRANELLQRKISEKEEAEQALGKMRRSIGTYSSR